MPKKDYSPVQALNRLRKFEKRHADSYFAEGFEMIRYGDKSGLKAGWSKNPAFLSPLRPFAQANGTGSFYALWLIDDREDLTTLPIVVFGDEGGQHVVARNLRELLQLLGYDSEAYVDWDEVFYHRDDDDEHSEGHEAYVAWLAERFELAPATDPAAIVAAAQAEYGQRFADWVGPFLPAEDD